MRRGVMIALGLVLGLLAVPAVALAAPGNDAFAARESLNSPLPIEKAGSNEGATVETGEPFSGFETGHSVWFDWVAPSSDWFTVGACDSNFAAAVGVFTGAEVDNLTRVVGFGESEGPDCFNQHQYTFHATAATHYAIRVAGESIPTPEGPPPPVEGTFTLRIGETPPPPNDDFAAAAPVSGSFDEEPSGDRVYFAVARGYNWTATTQSGEPDLGPGAGASVWYSWTVPESARYRFGEPCCAAGLGRSVYGGTAIDGLTPLVQGSESSEIKLAAGTSVRIAVYGEANAGTGEPAMGSFQLFISAVLPGRDAETANPFESVAPSGNSQADTTAPETKVDRSQLRAASRSVSFWFSASEPAQGFLCQLDRSGYKPCGSPRTYKHLKTGRHAFRVRAVDLAGNVDGSPAIAHFRVPKPYEGRR